MSCDVLVFSPHPDDAEFGMGGTMIRMVQDGLKVTHVALTPSQMSTHGDMVTRRHGVRRCRAHHWRRGSYARFHGHRDRERRSKSHTNRSDHSRNASRRSCLPRIIQTRLLNRADLVPPGSLYYRSTRTRCGEVGAPQRTVPDVPKHTVSRTFFYMVPRNVVPNIVVDITSVIEKVKEFESSVITRKWL